MNKEREEIRKEIFGKPKKEVVSGQSENNPTTEANPEINPNLLKMFPPERIERIKKKELRRYKAAQDRKWRNYLESVNG